MTDSTSEYFRPRPLLAAIVTAGLLAGVAQASTPEEQCQKSRYAAAAKYAACQQKAASKLYGGGDSAVFERAAGKCTAKYTAIWDRLAAKASGTGSSCDAPRYADNGDGTVSDHLTGLRWEKKTNKDATVNLADPHDADNRYSWSAASFTEPDGAAYTSVLATLNGACFAGQCDWRLPTLPELQTILLAPAPCATSPCIDAIFGPTGVDKTWTATSAPVLVLDAWTVMFNDGSLITHGKVFDNHVRAVRGGL